MRRAPFACAASAVLHVTVLGALASWNVSAVLWDMSVERGEPIMLAASLAQATPLSAPPPAVEIVDSSPPAVSPSAETTPLEVAMQEEPLEPTPIRPDAQAPEQHKPHLPTNSLHRASLPEPRPDAPQDRPKTQRRATPELELPTVAQVEAPSPSLPAAQALDAGAKVDRPPRKLPTNPAPDYPLEARRAGWEGRVVLLVAVDADGRVEQVQVRESSGYAILDDSAVRAVRRWRFAAARRGMTPVAAEVLVPVRFSIRG